MKNKFKTMRLKHKTFLELPTDMDMCFNLKKGKHDNISDNQSSKSASSTVDSSKNYSDDKFINLIDKSFSNQKSCPSTP